MNILTGVIQQFVNWAASNLTERSSRELHEARDFIGTNVGAKEEYYTRQKWGLVIARLLFLTGSGRGLSGKSPLTNAGRLISDGLSGLRFHFWESQS